MPESKADAPPRPRPIWSGTISFGLVSIPVDLFPANRSGGASLRMLDPEGKPLERRYYDPDTGKDVPSDRIVRGHEQDDGAFVVLSDEELEELDPDKSRDIDLRRFVAVDELEPMYFERAYFLTPSGDSTKAYRLLARVMEEEGRAGIATFVMRTKEYLVAILAEDGILRAETLRFHDEIRPVDAIDLPNRPDVPASLVRGLRKTIRAGAEDELDVGLLRDEAAERLADLVERKRKQKGAVKDAPAGSTDGGAGGAEIIDLIQVLKESLAGEDGETGARAGPVRATGPDDLDGLTKAELYERAKKAEIEGRSSMSKDELVDALSRSA